MKKQFLITFIITLLSSSLLAQMPTEKEIKAKKIKKITIFGKEKGAESNTKTEYYYDAEGNDTARYDEGQRSSYKIIEYNTKRKPVKITDYAPDGKETGVTTYTYKADGSSAATFTDTHFGMKNTYQYDKNGKILQFSIPDGSVVKYIYNSKGLLTKQYSIPSNGGVKYTTIYTYNAKNKMVLSKRTGDYASTGKYEYDKSTGLLIKTESISPEYSSTSTYEYSY